jgi:hypothetical protein
MLSNVVPSLVRYSITKRGGATLFRSRTPELIPRAEIPRSARVSDPVEGPTVGLPVPSSRGRALTKAAGKWLQAVLT